MRDSLSHFYEIVFKQALSFSTEFTSMAANTFRNKTRRTPMAKYIYSTTQCHVALDRLEQSTIDQIMQNSVKDNQKNITTMVCILLTITGVHNRLLFLVLVQNKTINIEFTSPRKNLPF